MRLISHFQQESSEVFVNLQNQSRSSNNFWVLDSFWNSPNRYRSTVVRRDMCVLFSLAAFLGWYVKNCQSSINIREEYCFLARESSDEDFVSTVACAVETTINASAVLCGVSTWTTLPKYVVIVTIRYDVIIPRADWNPCVSSLLGFRFPRIPVFQAFDWVNHVILICVKLILRKAGDQHFTLK